MYKQVDTKELDFSEAPNFKKTAQIAKGNVEFAQEEQEVITTIGDHEETRNIASVGDAIVTGDQGERYVIKADKFEKLYEVDKKDPELYSSKGVVQGVVLEEDIEFEAPWGETMRMHAGDTMVKNGEDIYGIEKQAFESTYGRATPESELIIGLDASTQQQRYACAEYGQMNHVSDVQNRSSLYESLENDLEREQNLQVEQSL